MSIDRLADAINVAWTKRYGGDSVSDIDALVMRINLIADDRDCWVANAKVNQAEYLKLDAKITELKKASVQ